MKPEDKELLLQDLCARLPYGVKIQTPTNCWTSEKDTCELKEIFKGDDGLFRIGDVGALIEYSKPYLFPLSSMTEEQLYEITELFGGEIDFSSPGVIELSTFYRNKLGCREMLSIIKWFLKNHFDIWGLIPKSLAIDATGLNVY